MADTYINPLPPSASHSRRNKGMRFTLEPEPPPPPVALSLGEDKGSSSAPSSSPAKKGMEKDLERWKEDDDDEWGEPVRREDKGKGKGREKAPEGDAEGEEDEAERAARKKRALERSTRAVTSESWDDDFDFQHAPAPPRLPRSHRSSHSHSHSRSRPTTPSHRHVSSSSASGYSSSVPPSTPSQSSRGRPSHSPPTSPGRSILSSGFASNPSLDSLASSINLLSDQDPTVTVDHAATSTPRPSAPPLPPSPYRPHHRPTPSTATVTRSFPPSQQTTPKSRIPRTSQPPLPASSSPPTDDDEFRSTTPSLTEDSLHSLTASAFDSDLPTDFDFPGDRDAGGEGSTTEDERTAVALSPREKDELNLSAGSGSGSGMFSGLKSVGGSKKWRFGRSNSGREKAPERSPTVEKGNSSSAAAPSPAAPSKRSSGLFGRRIGPREREPEVMVIDRAEMERHSSAEAALAKSRLPRPAGAAGRPGEGQTIVLGRRSRTSAGTAGSGASGGSVGAVGGAGGGSAIPLPAARTKHSSNTSVSTSSTSRSNGSSSTNPPVSAMTRQHRTSLHFAPLSFDPSARRGSTASSLLGPSPASPSLSWREYDGTTSEDGGETTGAEMSEFSGDDGAPPVPSGGRFARGKGRGRGSSAAVRGRSAGGGSGSITPSTSFMSASTRPVSPVESILLANGEADKSRWNASQVSFASTAEAFALRPGSGERASGSGSGSGAETVQGRRKKLAKKRPGTGESSGTLTASSSASRFPAARSSLSLSSTASADPPPPLPESRDRTLQSRSRQHRQAPSMPFAQESDDEAASQRRRTVRQRSVTSPEQTSQPGGRQRGSVVVEADDPEWLGVVPFPPPPRASLEKSTSSAPAPRLPSSSSTSSLRSPSRFLRKVSGADKSHPPVTARTQAEAKAAKRTSGLGASLSNILSRSTSALPLGGGGSKSGDAVGGGGKRAPSPAPSAKSGRSSKSMLVRRSSKGKKSGTKAVEAAAEEAKKLPKSPSLGMLRRRPSRPNSPAPPSRQSSGHSTTPSVPASGASSSRLPLPSSSTPPPPLPQSESAFSFFRSRGFSRSTPKAPPLPPSPVKSSIPRPSSDATPRPSLTQGRPSMTRSRPSNALVAETSSTSAVPRGQLNTAFKMPTRPHSTISNVSTTSGSTGSFGSHASTIMPLGGYRDAAVAKAMRSTNGPPVAGKKSAGGAGAGGKPPQTRSVQAGHRPSVSLSSIMPLRSASPRAARPPSATPSPPPPQRSDPDSPPFHPHDRPRTALGDSRPPTHYFFDDDLAVSESDFSLPRRNSLSDLKIPARITSSQKKIEEDLEKVKQFAKGIEDLKALKRQYDQLIQVFIEPPSPNHLSPAAHPLSSDGPSPAALTKAASAIRRVEIDYSQWWEQAQTLIDLGDGKPASNGVSSGTRGRNSPGALASKRDRCVSLAPETTPTKPRHGAVSGSETETEATFAAGGEKGGLLRSVTSPNGRRPMVRQASASSIETELSVEARQREMLRGVLAPVTKGASLPSRGPPPPRPGLSVLTTSGEGSKLGSPTASRTPSAEQQPTGRRIPLTHAHTVSPTSARKPPLPPPPRVAVTPSSRRVSRAGVFGIREFLLRLRSKATEELAASVGTLPISPADEQPSPPSSSSASPARRSVSDPASRPHTPTSSSARGLGLGAPPTVPSTLSSARRFSSSSSSDSGSDWDADLSPPRNSLIEQVEEVTGSMRARGRTVSVGTAAGLGAGGGVKELMILTTEAMPSLVEKVREVREKCEACVGLLKGLTV
ncbi:hypothetical protein JCM6882_004725 [Rhodosporidiobolus microsporus]